MSYKEKMERCNNSNMSKCQNEANTLCRSPYETNNICKSHATAKLDREMYRICPSKLSKRELEDLYFNLVENNIELKKTINGQQDKIRVLSTQMQRMSNVQDRMMSKEAKECCMGNKAVLNEQRNFIADLKEQNHHMAERIRQLNMRLCSAKQFTKTTPPHANAKSARYPAKRDGFNKEGDPVVKMTSSCQWEDRTPKNNAQTQANVSPERTSKSTSDQPCNEIKCRTVMEDLKMKVTTLQEELSNVHNEYSTRISRLESEVEKVRKENIRVNGERTASQHELENSAKRTSDALADVRRAESKCAQLTAQLSIEKRKVAELETQLKAADMSSKVHKAIEDHLSTIRTENSKCLKCCFKDENEATGSPPSRNANSLSPTRARGKDDSEANNTCDDSGYVDSNELPGRPVEQIENQKPMKDENDEASIQALLTYGTVGSEDGTNRAVARPKADDTKAKTVEQADSTQKDIDERIPNESNNYNWQDLVESARERIITDSPNKLNIIEKTEPKFENKLNNEKIKTNTVVGPGFNPEKLKYLEAEGVATSGLDLPSYEEKFKPVLEDVTDKLPVTVPLAANDPTAPKQTPEANKEECVCKDCAPYTSDTEYASKDQNKIPDANNELALGIQKEQAKKHDQHNSLQIPGPIPTLDSNKKNKNNKKKCCKRRKESLNKESLTVIARSATGGVTELPDVPLLDNREINSNSYIILKDTTKIDKNTVTRDLAIKDDLKPPLLDVTVPNDSTQSQLKGLYPYIISDSTSREGSAQDDRAQMNTEAQNTDQKFPETTSQAAATESVRPSRLESGNDDNASTNRRRSGPSNVRAENTETPACHCCQKHEGYCTSWKKGIQVQGGADLKRHTHSASQRRTYTIDLKLTAVSPDNTDLEMSCLSDLPMEKEIKGSFKARPLSPGEDRTTTYTISDSPPATDSLSEGEMPDTTIKPKGVPESDKDGQYTAASKLESPPPHAQQMEEALQAIAEELKRCKHLLQSCRPSEVTRLSTV